MRTHYVALLSLTLASALAAPAAAQLAPVPFPNEDCYAPAGDPEPGTPEWHERDTHNQYCATLRLRDQLASPAYGFGNITQGPGLYAEALAEQAQDPTHPRGGITTLVPGSHAADPFRTIERWTGAGRGRVDARQFPALNGATLRGHVFAPPASVPKPAGGYPGVVITDGSIQGYEELYFWAAEDLAEAGYVVMTYDVQGQGDSDLAGDDCPGECSGVPYQQAYNFYQGAEDSLNFFLSRREPGPRDLDADRVGIAGHSLGAGAVSQVGQCDTRVKAIVAWDNLAPTENCDGVDDPGGAPRARSISTRPALGIVERLLFNTQPTEHAARPAAKQGGYKQLAAAGHRLAGGRPARRDAPRVHVHPARAAGQPARRAVRVVLHAGVVRPLPAGRRGRVRPPGREARSTAAPTRTLDRHGRLHAAAAPADPTDPYAGNVPHKIAGLPVAERAVLLLPLGVLADRPGDGGEGDLRGHARRLRG